MLYNIRMARLWMVVKKKSVFLFHINIYFLAFWEAGLEMRPRQRMDVRLSHMENKVCSVQKISWRRVGLWHLFMLFGFTMCFFFFFFFFSFLFVSGSVGKSLVAGALSLWHKFSVHIFFFENCTYVKVKRENTRAKSIFSAVWYCFL